jgi:hypothetical protein
MSMEWIADSFGTYHADLGHGLRLTVSYENMERLPVGSPKYNVFVFSKRLKGRSHDADDAKSRAEAIARKWLTEALAAIGSADLALSTGHET